jgi:hypothetical protein
MVAPWAADPLSGGSIAAVEAIEGAVTVDLIATFEPQLACCAKTDAVDRLLADTTYAQLIICPSDPRTGFLGYCRSASFVLRRLIC